MRATARPGGTNHHQAASCSALPVWAQKSMVPSDQQFTSVRPTKASATEAPIA